MNQNYAIPRPAKTYREMAWQALKGIWGIAIVVALGAAQRRQRRHPCEPERQQ